VSSYLPDGSYGAPQLSSYPTPADDTFTFDLPVTPPGVSTQLESLYLEFVPKAAGFTNEPNAGVRIEWIDPTGQVIQSYTVPAPNID